MWKYCFLVNVLCSFIISSLFVDKRSNFLKPGIFILAIRGLESNELSRRTTKLSELIEKSYLAAKAYFSLGLKKGDYLSIYLPNTTEYHYNIFAAWLCGATVAPGDYGLTERVFTQQLEEVKPKVIVCYKDNLQKIKDALTELGLRDSTQLIVLSLTGGVPEDRENHVFDLLKLLDEAKNLPDLPESLNNSFDPEGVPVILWSSGTTGRPKGIQILNKTMQFWLKPSSNVMGHHLQTTCYFHGGGMMTPVGAINAGGTTAFFTTESLEEASGNEKIFQAIDKLKCDALIGGSHHVARLREASKEVSSKYDLSTMKSMAPMGSGIPKDTHARLKEHFPNLNPIGNLYGQSEIGGIITMSMTQDNLGHVYPGVELKIQDPNTEELCGPGKTGEILVRYKYVMKGYLNRPEEDAKFFGKDGFFHTGDLAHYNENGILFYDGRLKEIIKFQNMHIHPSEIEGILLRHPGVHAAGVFGRPHPEDQEHVAAVVVRKPGSSVTEEELQKLVKDGMEYSKWLRGGVFFAEELPRNPQGKMLRRRLIEFVKD